MTSTTCQETESAARTAPWPLSRRALVQAGATWTTGHVAVLPVEGPFKGPSHHALEHKNTPVHMP